MPGKRVQFDDETWQAIDAVLSRDGLTFQQLTDEAFKDVLKSGSGTEFRLDSIRFNVAIPEYIFSKAALKK